MPPVTSITRTKTTGRSDLRRIAFFLLSIMMGSRTSPLAAYGDSALIYTRMGVVFKASSWNTSRRGVQANGVGSTGPTQRDVFLPWTSVDSIRLARLDP